MPVDRILSSARRVPLSSPASPSNGLTVEPGATPPSTTRLNCGREGLLLSASKLAWLMPLTNRLASKVGRLTIAKISPVRGSTATAEPSSSPKASVIACCKSASIDNRKSVPGVAGTVSNVRTVRPATLVSSRR